MFLKALAIVIFTVWWRPFCDCSENSTHANLKCEETASGLNLMSRVKIDHNSIITSNPKLNLQQVYDVLMNNASKITLVKNETNEAYDSVFTDLHSFAKNNDTFVAFDKNGALYGTHHDHLGDTHFVEPHPCSEGNYQRFRCSQQFWAKNVSGSCDNEEGSKPVRLQPDWTQLLEMVVGDYARPSRRGKPGKTEKEESVVCDLKIVADFPFFSRVANFSKDEALKIILNVISRVDKIFRTSDFDQNDVEDNLRFFISDIKVFLEPIGDEANYSSEWDPSVFFSEFSRYDFSGACAGLLFTYREFPGNETYSPAVFKSTLRSTERGICGSLNASQLRVPMEEEENYGEFISNAVPVNFRWRKEEKACDDFKLMAVHTAHQLAQLFGAPTDDDTVCATAEERRMNIMAYPLPPATYPENFKFSSCSKVAMCDYLKNVSRECLRVCQDNQCLKRSMKFPVKSNEPFEKVELLPPVPTFNKSGAEALRLSGGGLGKLRLVAFIFIILTIFTRRYDAV